MTRILLWTLVILLIIPVVYSAAPVLPSSPTVNMTSIYNISSDDLYCWNTTATDADSDVIVYLYNWIKNNSIGVANRTFIDDPDLLAYYPMDRDNQSDFSNNYDLHVPATPTPSEEKLGVVNEGREFNESWSYSWLIHGNNSMLTHSVCLWIKAYPSVSATRYIYGTGIALTDKVDGHFITYQSSEKRLRWMSPDRRGCGGEGACNVDAFITDNQWYHVCGVRNHTENLLYINGVFNGSRTTLEDNANSSNLVTYIGAYPGSPQVGTAFNGSMDEIQIYNRSLTADEIAVLYRGSVNGSFMLDHNHTAEGDTFECEVRPIDYKELGSGLKSENTTINPIPFIFNVTFKDAYSFEVLNGTTIQYRITGDLYSDNFTVITGNYTLRDVLHFPFAEYSLRAEADGYRITTMNATILAYETINMDFYLTNDTTGEAVTATVYDESYIVVDGVDINVLRYDAESGNYILQQVATTNFEGKTVIYLETYGEYYKFLLIYEDVLIKETDKTQIYTTEIEFRVDLGDSYGDDFFDLYDVGRLLTFDNSTNKFTLTYTDPNEELDQACLKNYRMRGSGKTEVNSSCLTTTSGQIILGVPYVEGATYLSEATFGVSDPRHGTSLSHTYLTDGLGKQGLWGVMLMTIFFACLGFINPVLVFFLTPLPLVIGSFSGFVNFNGYVALGGWVVAMIIGFVISKR